MSFPTLAEWRPTRDTLHLYSRFLGAVRAALAEPHPLWWHISLQAEQKGFGTGELRLEEGGESFALTVDLERHRLALTTGGETRILADLREAPTGQALGETALEALSELGPAPELERDKWQDDGERAYDERDATAYRRALVATDELFERFRAALPGERSPVQLWSHHFDLSFERFFERTVEHGEGDEKKESRAQIGIGLSPGDADFPEAYYYANPWPFDTDLMDVELPGPGRWLTEPFEGSLLPYAAVAEGGGDLLHRYLVAVDAAAAPRLAS